MRPSKEAAALEYGLRPAPVLTAHASGEVAERIIAEAQSRGVHIAHDPRLVSMLGQLQLDQEIPPHLYAAVAVVLSWVYWLKGMQPGDEKNTQAKR